MDKPRSSPAAARNREPILEVLRPLLPAGTRVLEVAAGSGEHALYFSSALPGVAWLPSDADASALASIRAWRAMHGPRNLLEPVRLDAAEPSSWPEGPFDAVVCINMVHIAPWRACLGLMAGASGVLPSGGRLLLYGPFREAETPFAPSNAAFDADLRARNPEWGVRELAAVSQAAADQGLRLESRTAMPANNITVVFAKA
jgi:cyclopropane fatty-acyl-phospholipid synthase-like methyltransferase